MLSKAGITSCCAGATGEVSEGSLIHLQRSRWVNRFNRKRATRCENDQPEVALKVRYLTSRMAIKEDLTEEADRTYHEALLLGVAAHRCNAKLSPRSDIPSAGSTAAPG